MKMIEAIIKPECLEQVQEALGEVEVHRLTVSDVEGYSYTAPSQSKHYPVGVSRKLKLEIAVNEGFVQPTLQAILKGAQMHAEDTGAGKIFILPLEDVIRIRTGERGPEAI